MPLPRLGLALGMLMAPVLACAAAVEPGEADRALPPVVHYESATAILVKITPEGLARDCTVIQSSGTPELDARACAILMEKGRFKPMVDAKGNAIEGQYRTRIVWKITE